MIRRAIAILTMTMLAIGSPAATAQTTPGYSTGDLAAGINGLLQAKADDAWFVIEISGTPDFLQLYGSDGTAYLDFPIFTERQKAMRSTVEDVCADLGLKLLLNEGPNGLILLDYKLPQGTAAATTIVESVLRRIYSVDESTALAFETNGFRLPPPGGG